MSEYPHFSTERPRWAVWAVVAAGMLLVVTLKLPGALLALLMIGAMSFMSRVRPNSSEILALRSSIELSLDDINETLTQYENFRSGTDTDAIADRTLLRPELANEDSEVAEIESFHYLRRGASRFLNRVDAKLASDLDASQLLKLLEVTDQRAAQLQESWIEARRAARRLAP